MATALVCTVDVYGNDTQWGQCVACGGNMPNTALLVTEYDWRGCAVTYCADCVASGQAAYDVADRRGDRAAMAAADTAGE